MTSDSIAVLFCLGLDCSQCSFIHYKKLFAAVDYTDFRSSSLCILECKLNVFLYWQNNETEIELQVTFLLSLITM